MNFGVIVAGGRSERMGTGVDKAFLSLGSQPVLAYSLIAFERCEDIDGIILVVRKDRTGPAAGLAQMFGTGKVKGIVAGGATRQVSVQNGLAELPEDVKIVAVHDGARPMVTPELISDTIASAKRHGSGVAASKITDTVKYVERGNKVKKTVDRAKLWAVQTPQTFKVPLLRSAFDVVRKKRAVVTDEAAAVELLGEAVRLVSAPLLNIKITEPQDLMVAAALLKA